MGRLLFRDKITGDEILSSDFIDPRKYPDIRGMKQEEKPVAWEAEGAFVTIGGDDNIDIGANPSAEEAEEGVDSSAKTQVINIVNSFRLNKMDGFFPGKKDFAGFYKTYWEKLGKKLTEEGRSPEDVKKVQDDIKGWVVQLAKNFKQLEFYTGENMNAEGQMVICEWKDNAQGEEQPFFYVIAEGCIEEPI